MHQDCLRDGNGRSSRIVDSTILAIFPILQKIIGISYDSREYICFNPTEFVCKSSTYTQYLSRLLRGYDKADIEGAHWCYAFKKTSLFVFSSFTIFSAFEARFDN